MVVFRRLVSACLLPLFALPAVAADKKSVPPPSYYGPQPATEAIDLTMYARIREEGLRHSHVMEFAGGLADDIGPRLTGSPNMAKANAWTRDTLTAIGLQNAHLEDWGEFGMGWQQINTWARMVSPDPEPLWMQAAPWSPATEGPVSGEVVYVDARHRRAGQAARASWRARSCCWAPCADARHHRAAVHALHRRRAEGDGTYPSGTGRPGAPQLNIAQLQADRQRLPACAPRALKMMASEGVAAIITPSRDGGNGGGTGIIFDDNGANLAQARRSVKTPSPSPTRS